MVCSPTSQSTGIEHFTAAWFSLQIMRTTIPLAKVRSLQLRRVLVLLIVGILSSACTTTARQPIAAHAQLDLPRFMGDWYVIANIPTRLERSAHNAVETYRLDGDGTVATTFTFRDGAADGPQRRYTPRGFVRPNTGNAVWGVRFFWFFPVRWEYVVAYVDETYTQTIIARSARDYVWIMARTAEIPAAEYAALVERVRQMGYDTSRLNRVPQQWPETSP